MRRVTTSNGERWRCIKCLEETGWRPRHHHHHHKHRHHEATREERLVDAILRDSKPARYDRNRLGRSLLASLAMHAALVSLQFGSLGFGLPWLRSSPTEDLRPARRLNAVLIPPLILPPSLDANKLSTTGLPDLQRPPPPQAALTPDGRTLASLRSTKTPPDNTAPQKRGTPRPANTQARPTPTKKRSNLLATETPSTWTTALTHEDTGEQQSREPESSPVEQSAVARDPQPAGSDPAPDASDELGRKLIEEQALKAEEQAEKNRQFALSKARQEANEHKQAEEQRRLEAERKNAEQAALVRDAEEAQARKREEQAAIARVEQEALDRKRISEALRVQEETRALIEAKRRAAEEAALAKAYQDTLELKAREEQAAAAKAAQEAMDRQRAADLERSRLSGATSSANVSTRGGIATSDGRMQSPANKGPEQPGSTPPPQTPREALGADPRRKASIVGPDPKNIQLAFYGEGWRQKIERIGEVNYPRLYKDRRYDNLVVTVTINSDGTLAGVRIDKSSGQQEMDDAVRRIVTMSAPFAAFPPDLKRNFDQIDITRTWVFEQRPRIRNQ